MASIDAAQLSDWYANYGAKLALYARIWLDAARAEDAVQEVFIRLMGQRNIPENVDAWLFRAVRNEAISQIRRLKRRKKHHDRIAAERQNWFETRPDDLVDAQTAQNILQTLPDTQREIVVLRIWGQMTLKEIAEILGQPISTVHSRYQSALAAIKKKMELSCKTKET